MGSLNFNRPLSSLDAFQPLDLDDLRSHLHRTVDFIVNYYKTLESLPVLPQVSPGFLRPLLPSSPNAGPTEFNLVLQEIHEVVLRGLTHWCHPGFFAYFPATLSSTALAADLLASALNPVAFTWLSAPAAAELEALALDWLAELLGLPSYFLSRSPRGGGVIHSCSTEALLCSLCAARLAALRRHPAAAGALAAYASDQTHSAFSKACRIAGLNPSFVRLIPTSSASEFALDPCRLRTAMQADAEAGLIPFYVCATVGTTSSTAVDPVGPIADVAKAFDAYVHVDAAYAGAALICPELRNSVGGLGRVDSVSMSPHKWLLTCLDCTCLWIKDTCLLTSALGTEPEYLKNGPSESGRVRDYKDWQVGFGRRFRALKLWMVMRVYGAENLRQHIRSDVALAKAFENWVRSDARFQVLVPTRFGLVCFRLKPPRAQEEEEEEEAERLNRRLLESINQSGRVYMTHTKLGPMYVLRFTVGSTLTTERHVAAAWDLIKEKADEVVQG